jgi:CubicO group peptidase (beta-lactamase class C family)
LLAIISAQPLAFEPGTGWSYSNPGYVTLGILIHKVTGEFYGDFLQARVFGPLGMKDTRIISESDIVPHRAAGYRLVQGKLQNQGWVSPTLNTAADGSLYFHVLDLAKWDAALAGERLLKKSSLAQIWTPVKLRDGTENSAHYGFGWFCGQVNGRRYVEHGGAWQGFSTFIVRYLDDHLTVAELTNLAAGSRSRPAPIARRVAGFYEPRLAVGAETPPAEKPAEGN